MLLFVWMCVMISSIVPGGDHWVEAQTQALEREIQAEIGAAEYVRPGAAIGAAESFVRGMTPMYLLR